MIGFERVSTLPVAGGSSSGENTTRLSELVGQSRIRRSFPLLDRRDKRTSFIIGQEIVKCHYPREGKGGKQSEYVPAMSKCRLSREEHFVEGEWASLRTTDCERER